jgi:hypothetical protein
VQMRKWHTVVALVVGECVQLVGVGVELGRMVVQKVLLLVCYVVADSSTGASKSAAGIAGGRGQGRTSKSTCQSTNVVVAPK